MQESETDFLIQTLRYGEKECDVSSKPDLDSALLNSLKDLTDEDFAQSLDSSTWQDIQQKLKLSRRQALVLDTSGIEFLLFPTLTSGRSSTSQTRPPGQTKCERWFKDAGLVPTGYQLSPKAMALIMGFPADWLNPLSQCPPTRSVESRQDTSQEEALPQHKQPLPSIESSTSNLSQRRQPLAKKN
jgi:hypothetical protein